MYVDAFKGQTCISETRVVYGGIPFLTGFGLRKPVKGLPMFVDCVHGAVMFGILLCCELLKLTQFTVPSDYPSDNPFVR